MVELVWRDKEMRVTDERAAKILIDQEKRSKVYPVKERWELKDKSLKLKNGVIVRTSKGKNKESTE